MIESVLSYQFVPESDNETLEEVDHQTKTPSQERLEQDVSKWYYLVCHKL